MAKPEQKERNRALIGALILLGLVALVLLVVSLDELVGSRESRVRLVASLEAARGLTSGSPVWVAGHPVGTVEHITFAPPGPEGSNRIHIAVVVPREHLGVLRTDSRARLTSASIMGEPVLELLPGTVAGSALQEGDTLHAIPDATTVVDADRVEQLFESGRRVATSVSAIDSMVGARAPQISDVRARMNVVAAELDRLSLQLRTGPLADGFDAHDVMARIARIRSELDASSAGLSRYGTGEFRERIAALDQRMQRVSARVDTLRTLTNEPYHGFIGRAASDSALSIAIERARAQADSLIQESMENPFRYFF